MRSDYVAIYEEVGTKNNFTLTERYCDKGFLPGPYATSNVVKLVFHSNSHHSSVGFKISYKFVPVSQIRQSEFGEGRGGGGGGDRERGGWAERERGGGADRDKEEGGERYGERERERERGGEGGQTDRQRQRERERSWESLRRGLEKSWWDHWQRDQ